ncbi:MAG TPA: DegT/DnrJ/EryC1/StrS family aminotransferase [Vicinamibacterales bacterium]|nr:DegT/DnrJ/EryC1/StrS family aminotransferase [Vicinamibacterales bacterium]
MSSTAAPPQMIPVARPSIGTEELEAVRRPLTSGWLTQGPEVAAFEREFAAFVEAPYACAVSNCTTALHLALRAAGVGPGDEVITVSHSFIATANAIRYCGGVPVFVDVNPATYNIDPSKIAAAITARSRAILAVHQLGMPCDLAAVIGIARRHHLVVIEDAACAAGSEIEYRGRWQRLGRPHGDIACFSFHPRKVLTTGDGGMLTTANPHWDRQFRLWRQHAMSVSDQTRHASQTVVAEQYTELGFNYRLTDVQAAIGRVQLARLPATVARRREIAARYDARLRGIPGLHLPFEPAWARSNWQSYCVRLPKHVDQSRVMQAMLDEGISTRRGVMCAHLEPAYAREPWRTPSADGLAVSEQITADGLILPLYIDMTDAEESRVVSSLERAIAKEERRS